MKYQSELIKEMVDSRGHEKSSIHYQSECIETWIEEAKGAYPKLCDYESEWLNYIMQNPIGEFPYETVSTNTTATVNHVVPYAYKSAILKGQTLVNTNNPTTINVENRKVENGWQILTTWTDSYNTWGVKDITLFKPNTKYFIKVEVVENTLTTAWNGMVGAANAIISTTINDVKFEPLETGIKYGTFTTKSDFTGVVCGLNSATDKNETIGKTLKYRVMILEYQEGMENWDIPYFEGMQSVKMPVLKTTGKNLFDGELDDGGLDGVGNIIPGNIRKRTANFIKIKPNTDYRIGNVTVARWCTYNENFTFLSSGFGGNFNSGSAMYLKVSIDSTNDYNSFQIEEGSTATPYEPYKSNILSTSEDVELRGIGDVRDTLDCLTGELTQRIGEVVLDGSETWVLATTSNSHKTTITYTTNKSDALTNSNCLCDKFKTIKGNFTDGVEAIKVGTNLIGLCILRNKLETEDINGLKKHLSQNPITVQYRFTTESIKTVDLTVTDENNQSTTFRPIEGTMHITPTGEAIAPTAVLEVPVEAVTQNLASFIEGE